MHVSPVIEFHGCFLFFLVLSYSIARSLRNHPNSLYENAGAFYLWFYSGLRWVPYTPCISVLNGGWISGSHNDGVNYVKNVDFSLVYPSVFRYTFIGTGGTLDRMKNGHKKQHSSICTPRCFFPECLSLSLSHKHSLSFFFCCLCWLKDVRFGYRISSGRLFVAVIFGRNYS